ASEAEHAADGKIEFADDHRQAKPERDRSDGGELLQDAIRRAGGEKSALPAVERPQHQRDDDEEQKWTHRAIGEKGAHLCQSESASVCSMMTNSTMRPMARYWICGEKPCSNSSTWQTAMMNAPIKVRMAEPSPPAIAVPPTSTAL